MAAQYAMTLPLSSLILPDALGTDVWHTLYQEHDKMSVIITTSALSLYRNIKPEKMRLIAYLLKPIRSPTIPRVLIPHFRLSGSTLSESGDSNVERLHAI